MRLYRAERSSSDDPLDEKKSVSRNGWRFNDKDTPVIYASTRESLALLEVIVRPQWKRLPEIFVVPIDVPDDGLASLGQLKVALPTNWNWRPAAPDAKRLARDVLSAIGPPTATSPVGALVPSVLSQTDFNVLLDPRQKSRYTVGDAWSFPYESLAALST